MIINEDPIFRLTRQKAVEQWLSGMSEHEDPAVRDGVKATVEYIEDLKKQIEVEKEKSSIKDIYLKKLREKLETKTR